ncbi:transposase [Cryptosporangium phraense]|uniref:transposase n=1 Tax=Cryptosporangium phraense TaxID=2593070 RepID=UPI00197A7163|nr:transposase [Cryptosporangium phraense]
MRAAGTSPLDLRGIGPSGPARLLVEVGDITRFPTEAHLGSWAGTAPIDAVQLRNQTPGPTAS